MPADDCECSIDGISPNFHQFLSMGIALLAALAACIAYNVLELKRKKTFYGVEDKMLEEQEQPTQEADKKPPPADMKIVKSQENMHGDSSVRVLVKAHRRRKSGSVIYDYTPDWADTPILASYMRRSLSGSQAPSAEPTALREVLRESAARRHRSHLPSRRFSVNRSRSRSASWVRSRAPQPRSSVQPRSGAQLGAPPPQTLTSLQQRYSNQSTQRTTSTQGPA